MSKLQAKILIKLIEEYRSDSCRLTLIELTGDAIITAPVALEYIESRSRLLVFIDSLTLKNLEDL